MLSAGRRRHDEEDERRARHLATRLRTSREQRQFSQQDIATRAGVSISTLQKIEQAQTKDPGFFTVTRLAAALDLSLTELSGADG